MMKLGCKIGELCVDTTYPVSGSRLASKLDDTAPSASDGVYDDQTCSGVEELVATKSVKVAVADFAGTARKA
jgi:hypothetical protein